MGEEKRHSSTMREGVGLFIFCEREYFSNVTIYGGKEGDCLAAASKKV
jgi:hypothetical protein